MSYKKTKDNDDEHLKISKPKEELQDNYKTKEEKDKKDLRIQQGPKEPLIKAIEDS